VNVPGESVDVVNALGSRAVRHRFFVVFPLTILLSCAGKGERGEQLLAVQDHLPVATGMNVLVVTFDALRADALGTYGYPKPTSPNLDAFAEESLVFEEAYSASPVTPTSFAAMFTGLLPNRSFQRWRLVGGKTIAEHFQDLGYTTAAFLNNVQLTGKRGFGKGFGTFISPRNDADRNVLKLFTNWLDQPAPEPFFAWIHFLRPHAPYRHRTEAEHLYSSSYRGKFKVSTGVKFSTTSLEETKRVRDLYDGEVFFADSVFGDLHDYLVRSGHLNRTIVVVTADHGEEFKEHGRFQHSRVYQQHLRVPLMIRHPSVSQGLSTKVLISTVDLLPTLLEMVGKKVDDPLDGKSLLNENFHREIHIATSFTGRQEKYVSIQRRNQKLILTCLPELKEELFDLEHDPGELRNVAREDPEAVQVLTQLLAAIFDGPPCETISGAARGTLATDGLDDESVRALRALGYLE
jgi:arylsulfatase